MAITRIQSIAVQNIPGALEHRLGFGDDFNYEELISATVHSERSEIDEIIKYSDDDSKAIKEIIEYAESSGYKKKIRKNAVVQELLISYSKDDLPEDDEKALKLINKDISIFLDAFKLKFNFTPVTISFIHKTKDTNTYHVHIIFSLMDIENGKKARWKKRTYFDLIKKMSEYSDRIKNPNENRKNKNVGAYPLWLIRKLEDIYSREFAKEIIKIARERNYRTRDLMTRHNEIANEIAQAIQQQQDVIIADDIDFN